MSNFGSLVRVCASTVVRRSVPVSNVCARFSSPCLLIQKREYSYPKSHQDVRNLTKPEWEKRLTPEQFSVCREQCTEPPFSGAYNNHYEAGIYNCVCCGVELFGSGSKYDSGTGWPSFKESFKMADGDSNIIERPENSAAHSRYATEVICKRCDSHLGHVFPDGPPPTGKRYCINSVALTFTPQQ